MSRSRRSRSAERRGGEGGVEGMGRRKPDPPGSIVRVLVESLDDRATGEGRTDGGRRVRCPGVLPEESVEVEVHHVSRREGAVGVGPVGVMYGLPGTVLVASPDRVTPACSHFLTCGGCDFLHASLAFQHSFKERQVRSALSIHDERVRPILPSPSSLGYRAFAKLVVGQDGALGSYAPRTHDVVDMAGCVVHAPPIEEVADLIRRWLAVPRGGLDLRYVLIRASRSRGLALVTLVVRRPQSEVSGALVEVLSSHPAVARVSVHVNDSDGDALLSDGPVTTVFEREPVHETLDDLTFTLADRAFSQVNPAAAAGMYRLVSDLARPKGLRVLDLYAGSGGISLRLARDGAKNVVSVEVQGPAVEAARCAAATHGLAHVVVAEAEPVESFLARPHEGGFDVVVLNPPRKGASPCVIERLGRLAWSRLVYVSCNPRSLARDLDDLQRIDPVIRLVRAVPVDLFPQTRHVETIALVERS